MPLPLSGKVAVLRNTLWWWWINKNRQTWSFPVAQQDISPFELVTTWKQAKKAREKKSSTWFLFSQSDASNCTQINAQMRGWVHRSKAKVHLRLCVCVCVFARQGYTNGNILAKLEIFIEWTWIALNDSWTCVVALSRPVVGGGGWLVGGSGVDKSALL